MTSHVSVLLQPVLTALLPDGQVVKRVIDGTLGAGGHTRALLEAGVDSVLAFDLDAHAIAVAHNNLTAFDERTILCHASYLMMRDRALSLGWNQVDGILLDLGLSSMQLDTPERGFAFRYDAPLDMRFDVDSDDPTAAEWVNTLSAEELANIFYKYGEEKRSRQIAKAIIEQRPIYTTKQLADIIVQAVPFRRGKGKKIHPATQVFQALRIAVNHELEAVERVLPIAVDLLRPGGRLAVITFHSLEDRIVKQTFKEMATEIISPPGMASIEKKAAIVRLITRKPIVADDDEIKSNPRSRSAKLRVVEKLSKD
jgi:16S rRNA (cytosine1402-N4)-methyltransferase